jgi:hypothetical protein
MHHNTREELIDSLVSFLGGMIDGSPDADPISKTASYLLDDLQHLIVTEKDVEDFSRKAIADVSPKGEGLLMICLSVADPRWNLKDKFDFGYSGTGIPMLAADTVDELAKLVEAETPEAKRARRMEELRKELASLEA